MAYLADVNVLIALLHARHQHAQRAAAWLAELPEGAKILLCRVAQMGVLRILTNRSWLREDVLSAGEVWSGWDLLLTDDRFAAVDEPAGFESEWRRSTQSLPHGRSAETDFYFAAFATAGGHRLLTFDRGFRSFDGLDVLILE
jgi:hypothetical protein